MNISSPQARPQHSHVLRYAASALQLCALAGAAAAADPATGVKAFGPPGSPQFARSVAEIRAAVAAGRIDPRRVPLEASLMGLTFAPDVGAAPAPTPGAHAPPCPDGPGPQETGAPEPDTRAFPSAAFAYFEGFETYTLNTRPEVHPIPINIRLNGQTEPSGQIIAASSMYSAVALPTAAYAENWLFAPACPLSRNPYNPGAAGGYPADRDPAVEQAVQCGMGTRVNALGDPGRLTSTFLGVNLRAAPGALYAPTPLRPIVVCTDFFVTSSECTIAWAPLSWTEGFILTRVYMYGYVFGSDLAEPDGHELRPQILGPGVGTFEGQYYAPPLDPAPGLPTYHSQVGGWFTIALRLSVNSFEVFVRDSATDGSNGVLIDDSRDLQFFESGWTSIYPGQDAVLVSNGAGVATWRGYGRAVSEYGDLSPRPSAPIAAITCDGLQTLVGGDPAADLVPVFQPTNYWMDNFAIIGGLYALLCPSDLDADGVVGMSDMSALLGAWESAGASSDLNHDGVVNSSDLGLMLGSWGACPN